MCIPEPWVAFAAVGNAVYVREFYPATNDDIWTITYVWKRDHWEMTPSERYPGLKDLIWQPIDKIPQNAQLAALEFFLK